MLAWVWGEGAGKLPSQAPARTVSSEFPRHPLPLPLGTSHKPFGDTSYAELIYANFIFHQLWSRNSSALPLPRCETTEKSFNLSEPVPLTACSLRLMPGADQFSEAQARALTAESCLHGG